MALSLCLVILTFWPQININFQDSWCNISLSSLLILLLAVFEISCGKQTDKQTNKTYPRNYRQRG